MRHIISTVAMVAAVVLVAPVMAAEQTSVVEQSQISHQFLSKRPYVQPVVAKADSQQPWIGATLVVEGDKNTSHAHAQKLNMLGKRAF